MKDNQNTKIRKILHKYNLSPDILASIILLNEAELRGLKVYIEEHPDMASEILGYDGLFVTGLSKDYVDKREFNIFISLRELLQNALDEEELLLGQPYVNFEQNIYGIWIIDKGRGIKLEALRMGESNK